MLRRTLIGAALAATAAVALIATSATPASADGFIRIRRRPMQPRNVPLAVVYHKVTVDVKGQTATTEIDQVFRNPNNRVLEGTYMFPLPEDSAVQNFVLYVNGKPLEAELLTREKARQIYEDIVRSQKDPALLEYVGREAFQASIFPIPARGNTRIRLKYSQLLRHDAGLTTYRYPLNTEKFSSAPLEECAIVVNVDSDHKLGTIVSPSHPIDVARKGDKQAKVSWEARNVTPDKDFFLYIGSADTKSGMALTTHKGHDKEGTFLLMISPNVVAATQKPMPKDVIFVLDTSGSMAEGGKLKQAQRALRQCLGRLKAHDRFGLVSFSTEARSFREKLESATEATVKDADRWVADLDARGGTAIQEALEVALGMIDDNSRTDMKHQPRPAYVVFITDGAPTIGERDPDRLLDGVKKQAPAQTRIFCLGVGEDLSSYLIDKLSDNHRGAREYVTGGEDVETKVSAFYDKIAFPVMTDLKLELVGLETADVYPRSLPDLFRGSQLTVLGRYKGKGGQYAVRVTGNMGGEKTTLVYEGTFDGKSTGGELLPRLWAMRKIGYLLEEIRLRGETPEVKGEVVRLSKKYGVMTPYTSYLVVEDEMRTAVRRGWQGGPNRRPGTAGGPRESGPTGPTAPGGSAGRQFGDFARDRAPETDAAQKSMKSDDGRGIRASEELAALKGKLHGGKKADKDEEKLRRVLRTVGEKTFYKDGDAWVDSAFDPKVQKIQAVKAYSDAYMQLVRDDATVGKYLALGEQVTVVIGGVAYQVAP